MYKIASANFSLELTPGVPQNAFPYPPANSLRVRVDSCGFCADTFMDVDEVRLAQFAVDIHTLYETLTGSAELEEPYGMHTCLRFSAMHNGHIRVAGRLNTQNAYLRLEQELSFQNEIDQTELRDFALALYRDLGKYAE